ncbi:MAG: hypothetical protein WA637_15650 [Terriglobales bacterium]
MKFVVVFWLFTSLMALGAEQVKSLEDIPSSGGTTGCSIPHWCWEHDKGTNGSSTGSSKISGGLRRFDVVWKYYGGERFHIYLGPAHKDGKSTSFTLDTWVYFNQLATVNNIELDLNQVTLSGNTVIFGMQCNFGKGMWQYVTNHSGHPHWNNSNVACSRKVWKGNAWHHVILKYHRDSAGNVTYDSVTFDTKESTFVGASGPSVFGLGWEIGRLIVNFQIGGNKTSSGATAYLKNLALTGE